MAAFGSLSCSERASASLAFTESAMSPLTDAPGSRWPDEGGHGDAGGHGHHRDAAGDRRDAAPAAGGFGGPAAVLAGRAP